MTMTTHATFVIERRYDTSPDRVFRAWADPVAKRAWFTEGEGWDIRSYELDFREGGRETSRFRLEKGEEIFGEEAMIGNDTLFNEIVPNQRIVFTYSMDRNGARFSVSLACVELKADGARTRLVFSEHGAYFDGADHARMREAGWNELLDKLDAHLKSNA